MFSRQEKILLAILASIQFSSIVDFMIMMPLGPQLMRMFAINPHQFGLLVSSYTFFAGVSGFAASFFMDKFDRKRSLLVFFLGFSIGTIACGLSPTYETLLAARGLTGVFGGVLGSLVMSIVSDAISYERRGSAMGVVMTSFSLASVLGVPLSLFLANIWGWHSPFIVLGGLALLLCGVIAKAVPPMRAHLSGQTKEPIHRAVTRILQNPNQVKALIFMSTVIFGHFAIIPFMSPSLVSNAGLTEAQLPLMYMCGGLFTIFTSPFIGRLADRYGKHNVFFWGALLTIIPYFTITHLGPTPLWIVLCHTSFMFVVSGGRMIPASAMVSGTSTAQTRGSFMSIVSCVQQMASALASYIAGVLITKDANGHLVNYEIVGYIAIVTTFVALYLSRRIETVEGAPPKNPGSAKAAIPDSGDSLLH
ncbi:MFS transporter [Bdellovibrio sp. HCB337]|uniref:MFS transporter n=1 Tax=Bdellovibrio sp. HCB337 TaxID=3394358 RepID=UPI0039A5CEDB